jgi:hypothetical protein
VRQRPLISALALGLAAARPAAAAGVEVEVADTCSRVDRAQLTRLLTIEQRRDASAGVQQARVSVTCEGDVVTLRVAERGGVSLPRTRTLSAADVAGDVGARVLALSAIELLNARAAPESAAQPKREPEPQPSPVAPPTPAAARAPAPSVRLMAVGTARSFAFQGPLVGGGLSVDYLRLSRLGLRLEFDVAIAERHYELGTAHVQLTTLSAQAGYLTLHDAWSARAFVGYRLGAGRIAGATESGVIVPVGTVAGACGGPLISAGLGLRSGSLVAELGGEAGLVSFPLEGRVAGHDPIGLDRYWLGLSLNVGALL